MHHQLVLELIGERLQPVMQDPGDAGAACQVSGGTNNGPACRGRLILGLTCISVPKRVL
jgi:hypothetical protein